MRKIFWVIFRANLVTYSFVGDRFRVGTFNEDSFACGQPIHDWNPKSFVGVSKPEMDGEIDDFVVNDEMLPIVTERLRLLIEAPKTPAIQWLPITLKSRVSGNTHGYVLNFVELVSGALDLERTEITTYPQSWSAPSLRGKIWTLSNTTFISACVDQICLFRCSEYPYGLFCSDKFQRTFKKAGFTGASFRQVATSQASHSAEAHPPPTP